MCVFEGYTHTPVRECFDVLQKWQLFSGPLIYCHLALAQQAVCELRTSLQTRKTIGSPMSREVPRLTQQQQHVQKLRFTQQTNSNVRR